MNSNSPRLRAEAYSGKGYGALRYHLFESARQHIEQSIKEGYYCEAIAIIESVITDRLESRISYLKDENVGFQNLGPAIKKLKACETDTKLISILADLDEWRKKRNSALHELVKIEDGKPMLQWSQRILSLSLSATEGYELLKQLYHRVADLNPLHISRAFDPPTRLEQFPALDDVK